MNGLRSRSLWFAAIVLAIAGLWSSTLAVPHEFTDGAIISADEMNENFEAVGTAIAGLDGALPGVAVSDIGYIQGIPTTVVNLGSVTINCPSDGYVLLTLVGTVTFFGENTTVNVGIGTTTSGFDLHTTNVGRLDGPGSLRYRQAVTSMAVSSCRAGPTTFYANAQKCPTFAGKEVNTGDMRFVALFVPRQY